MKKLVLFCKSFHADVHRVRRLLESIEMFNKDTLDVYISVPSDDTYLFKKTLGALRHNLLTDEAIIAQSEKVYGRMPQNFPKHLIQQLMKLEFWRLDLARNYLWIDSDSYFIRPFEEKEFFYDEETPFTVANDGAELIQFARRLGNEKIVKDFKKTVKQFKLLFGRVGDDLDFGTPPLIWSGKVLKSLAEDYLLPAGQTIFSILQEYPCEIQLYGEYFLHSKVLPFRQKAPWFKFFHYPEQFYESQYLGEWDHSLARDYMGVVIQSNWAKPDFKKMKNKTLAARMKGLFRAS